MKVLVLSPGQPSSLNSGLGTAANALNQELASLTELIVVQPDNIDKCLKDESFEELNIELVEEVFSEENINKQNVQITVSAYLDAYHYGTSVEKKQTISDEEETIISKELKQYNKQVIKGTTQFSFDLIYAHDWITLQAATELKEKTGKPVVVHIHSLDYDRGAADKSTFVYDIEYEGLKNADAIIAVSQYTKNVLVDHYDVDADKITVVHNAIEHYEIDRQSNNSSENLVLFVGRMTGQKGPELFIDIAQQLLQKRDDVRFVMAGGGALLQELIQRGQDPMSNGKIHFTGELSRDAVFELYAQSSVYCMPSVSEPFGLSAIEAAQAGVPVVLSKSAGAAEVLKGAYKADAIEVNSFVKQIESALDNKKDRSDAVKLNLECISNSSWENAAQQVYKQFQKLIS